MTLPLFGEGVSIPPVLAAAWSGVFPGLGADAAGGQVAAGTLPPLRGRGGREGASRKGDARARRVVVAGRRRVGHDCGVVAPGAELVGEGGIGWRARKGWL